MTEIEDFLAHCLNPNSNFTSTKISTSQGKRKLSTISAPLVIPYFRLTEFFLGWTWPLHVPPWSTNARDQEENTPRPLLAQNEEVLETLTAQEILIYAPFRSTSQPRIWDDFFASPKREGSGVWEEILRWSERFHRPVAIPSDEALSAVDIFALSKK